MIKVKYNSGKRSKIGTLAVWIVWLVINATIIVTLYCEGRYWGTLGWLLIFLIILFFTVLTFVQIIKLDMPGGQKELMGLQKPIKKDEGLVLLFASKDYARVMQAKELLQANGIECVLTDEHATRMMNFLPDVEIRLLVPSADFTKSQDIIQSGAILT